MSQEINKLPPNHYPKIAALRQKILTCIDTGAAVIAELNRIKSDFEKFCDMLEDIVSFSDAKFDIDIAISEQWLHLGYKNLVLICDFALFDTGAELIRRGVKNVYLCAPTSLRCVIDNGAITLTAQKLGVLELILAQLNRVTAEVIEDIVVQHVENNTTDFYISLNKITSCKTNLLFTTAMRLCKAEK